MACREVSVIAHSSDNEPFSRKLGVTIVWLPNLDRKDHDGDSVLVICLEDIFHQPMSIEL